ncbi:hypothetical protein BofuT4_uP084190.1 [Botrytis cinerea T4]|uniref:Uncharacterized protein n=1 Tax=Botryotinia fuckeliana (strain T4) TaxID=999810 RepID=G2YJH8_BOTF4|nr:hypothetical protein BofuT4_uP084190.1 [Botrytis cinerea T4]
MAGFAAKRNRISLQRNMFPHGNLFEEVTITLSVMYRSHILTRNPSSASQGLGPPPCKLAFSSNGKP